MDIKFKKMHKDAKAPKFAHSGDAGMDIFSLDSVSISFGEVVAVPTGISIQIPKGYVALVWDKSGLALKGLKTVGGVIDSGFRGEIKILVTNLSKNTFKIKKGEKVAQILIQKVQEPNIKEVSVLDETERGEGGFGSTGLV